MNTTGYKTKVSAVVAGLALTSGLAVAVPQAAFASTEVSNLDEATKLEALVDDAAIQGADAQVVNAYVEDSVESSASNSEASEEDTDAADSSTETGTEDKADAGDTNTTKDDIVDDAAEGAVADAVSAEEAVASKPEDNTLDTGFAASEDGTVTQEETVAYKDQWEKSGDKYYYWNSEGQKVVSGWAVTAKHYDGTSAGLQRYWFGSDGSLAFSNLFSFVENDVTYWGYATKYGYVVRGKYTTDDGLIYLADNDGKLESAGWLVTSAYGDGLQRYYIDSKTHSAVVGLSTDGYAHYTTSTGYVLRGGMAYDGSYIYADNDGKLQKSGWLVTSAFSQGLQRYWMKDYKAAKSTFISKDEAGYAAYATDNYYVLRGGMSFDNDSSRIYADNDGKLYQNQWLVTSAYGQGLQRYWAGSDYKLVKSANIDASKAGYAAFATENYYVLRGFMKSGSSYIYANNDGRLYSGEWLVTSELGQGLQRYWVNSKGLLAKNEYISAAEAGYAAYATDNYYVLRGALAKTVDGENRIYLADNDGKLARSGDSTNDWLVSSAYNQGLQRYFVYGHNGKDGGYVKVGYSSDGYAHYTTENAYVLRGTFAKDGKVYLADNDGKLAFAGQSTNGWIVTSAYGHGLQRYYVYGHNNGDGGYAKVGYSTEGYAHYTTDQAYVLRGKLTFNTYVLLANNDGLLEATTTWLRTTKYDSSEQLYYMEAISGQGGLVGAKTGYFNIGENKYYGIEDVGYVVRGTYRTASGTMIYADDDGVIYTTLVGIDIHPDFQAGINLYNVEADFVIIKISQGTTMDLEVKAKALADAAIAAGKKVGFYHFVDIRRGAVAEADYFSNLVGSYAGKAILVLDWENNDVTGQKNLNAGPSYAKAWLDRVYQRTGVKALIYMNRSATQSYDWASVAGAGYKLWVAQYLNKYYYNQVNGHIANPDTAAGSYGAWDNYGGPTIYQYTDNGKISGYGGTLDLDVFYGSRSMWDQLAAKQ